MLQESWYANILGHFCSDWGSRLSGRRGTYDHQPDGHPHRVDQRDHVRPSHYDYTNGKHMVGFHVKMPDF